MTERGISFYDVRYRLKDSHDLLQHICQFFHSCSTQRLTYLSAVLTVYVHRKGSDHIASIVAQAQGTYYVNFYSQ